MFNKHKEARAAIASESAKQFSGRIIEIKNKREKRVARLLMS